jgi:magnesium chelatase family protein
MLFLVQSAAVYGIDALIVDIEVNLQPVKGEADTVSPVLIVGLPDTAIRESRERIRAAITNSSFFFPFHKTTINLAPADVRKEGASFDCRLLWEFWVRTVIWETATGWKIL